MPKPDPAHKETDKLLKDMEKELNGIYKQAYREARETADDFMKQFRAMDKAKRQQIKDETDKDKQKELKDDYERWRRTQIFQGNRYHQMADTLAADMSKTNQIAASVINGHLPEVYAVNHNYATYEIEKGSRINTQYTLYDAQTVEHLVRDKPDLIPRKAAVNIPKDEQWNKQHINSAVLQGILQGKSNDDIAKDLATTITTMSHTSAIRNARTMTTSAENGGRIDSYKRAESMGINMLQIWVSTLDDRTRHEHRLLDGQKRKVGEPFEVEGEKIFFPGDPAADPALVYNCRCTLIGQVETVNFDLSDTSQRESKLGNMTYEEWKESKSKPEPKPEPQQGGKPQPTPQPQQEPATIDVPAPVVENPEYTDVHLTRNYENDLRNIIGRAYDNHIELNNLRSSPSEDVGLNFFNVEFTKMDNELKNAVVEQFTELTSKYDTTLQRFAPMNKLEFMAHQNSFATTTHNYETDSSIIKYNPVKITDIERIEELITNGYAVRIPIENANKYIITHEFAHTLIDTGTQLNKSRNWVNADYKKIESARKEMNSLFEQYIKDVGAIDKERKAAELNAITLGDSESWSKAAELSDMLKDKMVSKYSMTNADDFFAECFTHNELGGGKNEYVDKAMKIINKYFKR